MKTKFQLHIVISLLLVYVLNFGVTVHDVFANSISENTVKKQTTHKSSKDNSSHYYANQDLEIIGHTSVTFNLADVFQEPVLVSNNYKSLHASQAAKDNQYYKTGKYIIPSLNIQTCLFPFHDFI
ncbi:hypothetical protein BZARG_2359 [Bizionia argentinensis JUB59]|uniref:Uncharacterized protein n=1 Tax=Bizionia argentinensis JUB59 TaxID=1046627 RepID=G2ECB7_9FLAO|nr:hypothetical protein [Bizionia argentinensis]EGV43935.1 hypothetical protein BZARG_2359 [Bizionia argentinensis JUB59]